MGNYLRKNVQLNPGSVLDRVISQASNDDDCLLYKLANYKKGGELIDAYGIGGMAEVEKLMREQFGILMYKDGEGQVISRTEYLRWKFRNVRQVVIPVEASSAADPLGKWADHEACWQMQYRGSLGETLLHVLIICDTKLHTRLARVLLRCFPKLALDVFEGEEYLGASALHLAIAYTNNEIVHLLMESGARVDQRAIGSFFLPKDQQRIPPLKQTDYEGLAYFGEYPLAWSACVGNESVYNLLLDKGAHPDWQDSFGNMILHMVVVTDQLGMYGYALRHPKIVASNGVINLQGLTPLTLACRLGRASVFREMLELSSREFWRYSNHTCSAYPLNALDTISPDGRTNWNSALFMILEGSKEEHLDMLDGGIIQRLLEEKWKTFAQRQFLKRITIAFIHLLAMSFATYLRPSDRTKSLLEYNEPLDYIRLGFEISTIISSLSYVIFQQGEEIKNQGFASFLKQLPQSPPKALFLLANFSILGSIPFRITGDLEMEEVLLSFSMVGSWFFMMFFAGAVKLTGPFITMIFSMVTGDMLTFGIIYLIFLLAFSQAFYYLYKSHPTVNDLLFESYGQTWMAMYQMTLGSYNYNDLSLTAYPNLAKGVFITFMIFVPILLLNMLIAMMGNTYAQVIERSEKEWVKQWAKLVVSLERAVSQELSRTYIQEYSIKLPSGGAEELRGVMVIKTKNKTRAKQRKGAVSNWKRVGKVTIHALKKRGMTGEEMRLLMWGHRASISTPQGSTPRQLSMEIGDPLLQMGQQLGLPTGLEVSNLETHLPGAASGDGTIRLSSGNLGSSVNPFGCFDDMNLDHQPPMATSPLPSSSNGPNAPNGTAPSLSSLPPSKTAKMTIPADTALSANNLQETSPSTSITTVSKLKSKSRHITFGLRPKIVIFSDPKNLIRVNIDSDESDTDILYNPRYSSRGRMSMFGNALSSSHESLHDDTDKNGDSQGTDNPAFVPDELVPGVEASSVPECENPNEPQPEATPRETPTISVTEDRNTPSDKTKSKRPKSAKHSGKAKRTAEPVGPELETAATGPGSEAAKPQRSEPSKDKKSKERPTTARKSEKPVSSDRRPKTAFTQNGAGEVSSMNNLVAWDRPEDDL